MSDAAVNHINDHLFLICGHSTSGKSTSFRNLQNPEGVMYLNCESGKKLPFKSKFMELTIVDPYQIYEAFQEAENMPHVDTIIVDSLTYLMDMFESLYIHASNNKQTAWGDFQQYFKNLMQQYVAASTKNVIFTAHLVETLNEAKMEMETKVPIKGALKGNGVESYFSVILYSKKETLKRLNEGGYESKLLNMTEDEKDLGIKHVFQTRLTKESIGDRIRGPMDLWTKKETFIDNDAQFVIDRLREYYA